MTALVSVCALLLVMVLSAVLMYARGRNLSPPKSSSIHTWTDFYATADPVPNGALFDETIPNRSIQVVNHESPFLDHVTYWSNHEHFISAVVQQVLPLHWSFRAEPLNRHSSSSNATVQTGFIATADLIETGRKLRETLGVRLWFTRFLGYGFLLAFLFWAPDLRTAILIDASHFELPDVVRRILVASDGLVELVLMSLAGAISINVIASRIVRAITLRKWKPSVITTTSAPISELHTAADSSDNTARPSVD